jgi:hypothetical protein
MAVVRHVASSARQVVGPGEGKFVTTAEAAVWLHLAENTFKAILAEELPWLQPARTDRLVLWDWLDIVLVARYLEKRPGLAAAEKIRKKFEGQGEPGRAKGGQGGPGDEDAT